MMRAAVVRDGLVENVVVVGTGWQEPEGCEVVPHGTANIGDGYIGGVHTPQPQLESPRVWTDHEVIAEIYRDRGAITQDDIDAKRTELEGLG